jgi:hypothetical protein
MDNVKAMRLGDGQERGPVDQADPNVSDRSSSDRFSWLIDYAAIALIILTCISLVYTAIVLALAGSVAKPDGVNIPAILAAVRSEYFFNYVLVMISCVSWSLSMGCIGAIASMGMKAVKVPGVDEGFDLSDTKSVFLRMVLGGLFALVLTVSFTSDCFFGLCYSIGTLVRLQAAGEESPSLRAFILIIPFSLGFSTSLVMLLIKQLSVGILAFFGKLGPQSDAKTTGSV